MSGIIASLSVLSHHTRRKQDHIISPLSGGLLLLTSLCRQDSLLFGLLDLLQNRVLQALRLRGASPTTDNLAIRRYQELLKVPLDALQAQHTGLLGLHPRVDRSGIVTVDVDLAQHGECHAIVDLAERLDLIVGARVLVTELVAGESDDGEGAGFLLLDGLVELLETLELRGKAALGSGVDSEDDLAFEVGEGE